MSIKKKLVIIDLWFTLILFIMTAMVAQWENNYFSIESSSVGILVAVYNYDLNF